MKITIDLTDAQHERLVRAAAYVGNGTTVQELIIGNAFAHMDSWGSTHKDIRDALRHGVTFYARKHYSEPHATGEEGLDYCVGVAKADGLPADVEKSIATVCREARLTRPAVIRHAVSAFLKTHTTPAAVRADVVRILPQKQSANPA
jgi:hypothetical protein